MLPHRRWVETTTAHGGALASLAPTECAWRFEFATSQRGSSFQLSISAHGLASILHPDPHASALLLHLGSKPVNRSSAVAMRDAPAGAASPWKRRAGSSSPNPFGTERVPLEEYR